MVLEGSQERKLLTRCLGWLSGDSGTFEKGSMMEDLYITKSVR